MEKKKYIPIGSAGGAVYESYRDGLRRKYGSGIYALDPYVEVFKVLDNVWAMFAPCTHAMGDNWIYLIEGPEKALFIDNGFGLGDLRGLGEMLTGKPCITAVTHFHLDHSGGSAQFDEVYCHEYCADIMRTQMTREAWDKFNHVGEEQQRPYYLEKDITYGEFEPIPLQDHAIINLGEDYDIELILTGGHTPGLSCFLDKKSRVLYTGDAVFESRPETPGLGTTLLGGIIQVLHPEAMDYRFYKEHIDELAKRIDEWDMCMSGHGFICSPATIVTDTRDAIDAIVANPHDYDEKMNTRGMVRYNIHRGLSRVSYSMDFMDEVK